MLNDTTLNHDFDHDNLDDQEEDVDGIKRDPTYPYHPCPDTWKGTSSKHPDPHQKYHHYNSYNLQSSRRETTKSRNFRSSDSSKENLKRNSALQKNSHVPSHQKRQRTLPNEGKYLSAYKTADGIDLVPRKRDSRQFEGRNASRRRHTRNMEQNSKTRSKELRKSTFIQSPYHEGEGEVKQEKNNGLIKNHTKLMDQIMDDLIAEATDNEGQYYLDLAGNVRKVFTSFQ